MWSTLVRWVRGALAPDWPEDLVRAQLSAVCIEARLGVDGGEACAEAGKRGEQGV